MTPPNTHDPIAWRQFAAEAILLETRDPNVHPYSYVVPAGDVPDAVSYRKGEVLAIRSLVGHSSIPGNMIAVTGPDSRTAAQVVVEAFKGLPPRSAAGLKVLFIGVPGTASEATKVVAGAGAALRVRSIKS